MWSRANNLRMLPGSALAKQGVGILPRAGFGTRLCGVDSSTPSHSTEKRGRVTNHLWYALEFGIAFALG